MGSFPGDISWIEGLIPDLKAKEGAFVVEAIEPDEELLEIFVEELTRQSDAIKEGLAGNDMQMVREAGHSIKGMGGTIGLPEISVLGLTFEESAKANDIERLNSMSSAIANWLLSVS